MSRIADLRMLAAGLCHDADIGVQESDGQWAWSPERRIIFVDRCDLETMGPAICAGIIAHEVGHALISRYVQFASTEPDGLPVRKLANAVEDPRVEVCMADRYPGVGNWMQEGHRRMVVGHRDYGKLPYLLQFGLASASSHNEDWGIPADLGVARAVRDALERSMEARRVYAEGFLPKLGGPSDDFEVEAVFEATVVPELRWIATTAPTREDMAIHVWAMRAWKHFLEHIVPHALPLWRCDVATVMAALQAHPGIAARFRNAGQGERCLIATATVREAMMQRVLIAETGGLEEDRVTAVEMLTSVINRESANVQVQVIEEGAHGTRSSDASVRLPKRPANDGVARREGMEEHAAAREAVAPSIEALVRELDRLLAPRARLGERTGYRSGVRADLRAVIHAEARGDGYDRTWVRRTVPDRRRAAFMLLVDLSGSMRGAGIEAALQGAVLFTEALNRLKIPHAVRGFQDQVIPFLSFNEKLCEATRARLGQMRDEVSGERAGGHNKPNWNDDGPCLLEVAEELMGYPAEDRVLVVISDGQPSGDRSDADDLRNAVAKIRTEMRSIALVGIGIGSEASCVGDFYPEHVVEPSVRELPLRVSNVLRKSIARNHPAMRDGPSAHRTRCG